MVVWAGCRIYLFAACFLVGAVIIQQASELPSPWCFTPILLCIAFGLRHHWLLPCTVVAVGSAWAVLRAGCLLDNNLPPHLERKEVHIVAVVSSLVQRSERYLKFTVDVESLRHLERVYDAPDRIQLRWYYPDADVKLGQRWRFKVKLRRAHGFQNPGGFDYERWLFRHGIRATGYVLSAALTPLSTSVSWWGAIREKVQRHLGRSDLPHEALLRALSVGDRGGMSADQWRVLLRTGTIHLLAISGLHIGLVAGFGFVAGLVLTRLLGIGLLWLPAPRAAAVLSIAAALTYALLAGFTVPTQRAGVMVTTVMAAMVFDRDLRVGRSLALALIAVLILDPLSVLDTGFWLSFSALISIVLALRLTSKLTSRIVRAMCIQLLLSMMLSPLVLLFFDQVSLSAPLANLVAIPTVAFTVVPLVLMGTAALTLNWVPTADLLYTLADLMLRMLWPVLKALAEPEGAVWMYSPDGVSASLIMAAVLCLFLPLRWMFRLGSSLLGLILLLAVAIAGRGEPIATGSFSATVLDVGQGLSVVIRTRNHTMLYDTGARFSRQFDAGRAVVVPFLRDQTKGIDLLVVSHGDNDHIGGLEAVLQAYDPARRLTSVREKVPRSEACTAGQRWDWDGVQFVVLSPERPDPPAHNNASCVIKITGRHDSLLLTGDIERPVERRLLLRRREALRSDVLLVPHQGSETSSSPAFIDAVAPQVAIVSAGYLNKYGHPADSVTERYRKRSIALYNTAEAGAVTVHSRVRGLEVERYRTAHRRYWFD